MRKLLLIALLLPCLARRSFSEGRVIVRHSLSDGYAWSDTTAPRTAPLSATLLSSPLPAAAPVKTGPTAILLRVSNPDAINNVLLEWQMTVNGIPRQHGTIPLHTGADHNATVRLQLRIPRDDSDEVFLNLFYRARPTPSSAVSTTPRSAKTIPPSHHPAAASTRPAGPLLATQQLLLKAATGNDRLRVLPSGSLSFTDSNDIFTIRSGQAVIKFNKESGWLIHFEIDSTRLLDDSLGLRSNFWWPGYNDIANQSPDSGKGWLAATRDPHLQLFSTSTGSEMVIVRTEYTLPATSCLLHISYTINAAGEMLVSQQVEPDSAQRPDFTQRSDSAQKGWPLPCFGMQWIMPPGFDSITYYGQCRTAPGVNDQDRAASPAWISICRDTTRYPPAADTFLRAASTRAAIRWWKITAPGGAGLLITADSSLAAISALHSFDNDALSHPGRPPARPQIQLSIDRLPSSPLIPAAGNRFPIPLPYGNYQFSYRITPISASHPDPATATPKSTRVPRKSPATRR